MTTGIFSTFCAFLRAFSFHMRAFFTSAGRMSQKLFWILVMYFVRPVHIIFFLHSCTVVFTLRALVRCHPPYRYLIWFFWSTLMSFFIGNWSYCCATTIFYLWGLDDIFHVLFQFQVLFFDKYVGLVESDASNLTLRGWRLIRNIFSKDKGALP